MQKGVEQTFLHLLRRKKNFPFKEKKGFIIYYRNSHQKSDDERKEQWIKRM